MKESDLQNDIMSMLLVHSSVAWAKVNTTGRLKGKGGKHYTIGMPGESDIIGQMKDGRFMAIEVKLPGNKPTQVQHDYLNTIRKFNGVSGWATTVDEAIKILEV